MNLNLKNLKSKLLVFYKETLKFDFDASIQNDVLTLVHEGTRLNGISDDIIIIASVYKDGALNVRLVFDSLKDNMNEGLQLINVINMSNPFLRAFVNDNGLLVFDYTAINVIDDEQVIDNMRLVLGYIASFEFIDLVRPICNITKSITN